jgi:hypothetical protein
MRYVLSVLLWSILLPLLFQSGKPMLLQQL